jgi:DNA-binding MarR family transcriptional regulator
VQGGQVDDVTEAVLSASRVLVGIAARSIAAVDSEVTLPRYRALVVLCGTGTLPMSDLADRLACSRSTATRLCDRLVRDGLVERRSREDDRRSVEVVVTRRGANLVRKVTERRREEIAAVVAELPNAQRRALVEALRAFADAADEAPDQAWTTGWEL